MPVLRKKQVVGLDPSLTSTGLATVNGALTIISKPGNDDLLRLRRIVATVLDHCHANFADLVVIEGLSYGSTTGKATDRAGLHWLIRDALDSAHIPVALVTPAARAKYATGKGNAGKDAVLIDVVKRWPMVLVANNNEADAVVLLAMGLDYLGDPLAVVPAVNRLAIGQVKWPFIKAGHEGAAEYIASVTG